MVMMKVQLLEYTRDGIKLVANAVRITGPFFDDITDDEIVYRMVKHDYGSALEHISFTFLLKDISVAITRELLEHRIASHTAKSTRYVSQAEEMLVYVPGTLHGEHRDKYLEFMKYVHEYYKALETDVGRESARYVLPMGLLCTYTWTVNARSLINFFRLRLCCNAAPEMQMLANRVLREVRKVYPLIFNGMDCRGAFMNVCPEPRGRSCGKYIQRKDLQPKEVKGDV
jgi:thymidylate synthase (FAD)